MDRILRILRNAQQQLSRLTPTSRLLIGSVLVIMVMFLLLVSLWAGKPERAEIYAGASSDTKTQALTQLRASGIEAVVDRSGRLMVRQDDVVVARGVLASQGVLPADGTILFSDLAEKLKWTNPREINQQIVRMALQGELARTISNFPSLKKATVFLDVPAPSGIGLASRTPTASVTVFSKSNTEIKQDQVDAIARLVSTAVSGLTLDNISVIDGTTGRYHRPRSDEDTMAASYLDHKKKFEREVEQKIRGILSNIPGAIVAVTADVDVKRVTSRREAYLKDGEGTVSLPNSTSSTKEETSQAVSAAEPGTRPNTGADINQAPSKGNAGFLRTEDTTAFDSRVGSEITSTIDPRGMATSLNISVQVPHEYVEALVPPPADAGEAGAEGEEQARPDPAAVAAAFETERQRIAALLQPHLPTVVDANGERKVAGEVVVSMMPINMQQLASSTQAAGFPFGAMGASSGGGLGGLSGLVGSGLIEKGMLALLAGVSIVMMLLMVRKATKQIELPAVEDIVGIPPALGNMSDVVGEADESETPMEGIEIDSEHVTSSKMLEQVAALVDKEPELTARLLNRWIEPEN
ncbi:MAG TPA: hypothetical protein ENJ00_12175 [Phycisphaerales bacterium]|nr:hypothetical protein [Phycisphaerales bacterium]